MTLYQDRDKIKTILLSSLATLDRNIYVDGEFIGGDLTTRLAFL